MKKKHDFPLIQPRAGSAPLRLERQLELIPEPNHPEPTAKQKQRESEWTAQPPRSHPERALAIDFDLIEYGRAVAPRGAQRRRRYAPPQGAPHAQPHVPPWVKVGRCMLPRGGADARRWPEKQLATKKNGTINIWLLLDIWKFPRS